MAVRATSWAASTASTSATSSCSRSDWGQGADAEQIIRGGLLWSGLDLTAESVARVRTRLELRQLPYDDLKHGSALAIPCPDNAFDKVFSHGVLHHIPDIRLA
jgi:ubiquinone/menaquinone biosynthesis C-methylase UbiE